MSGVVALVDCNNFYASCERLFNPRLEGQPVLVLSNNDGCVVARSNEAKALGIGMGVPEFQIRHLIKQHRIHVFSSNYTLYGDLSQRVMDVLEDACPDMEVYSIDEAFLNLAGFPSRDRTEFGRLVRARVKRWTGIPVSIGIGETKTLAKIANRIAKRTPDTDGVFDLLSCPAADRDLLLGRMPLEDVWGVGPSSARLLTRYGMTTALQLRDADDQWIRKHMGIVGMRLVLELRGVSCLPLEECPPSKQSMTCSRTFGRGVETMDEMGEAVSSDVTRLGEKLRREGLTAGVLTVFVTTNRFKKDEPQYSNTVTRRLPVPTDLTPELIQAAIASLTSIFRPGYVYKKAGVFLSALCPAGVVQTDCFDHRDRAGGKRLMRAVDAVNARWGAGTVGYASSGFIKAWRPRFDRRSPAYTTSWDELPVVRAC